MPRVLREPCVLREPRPGVKRRRPASDTTDRLRQIEDEAVEMQCGQLARPLQSMERVKGLWWQIGRPRLRCTDRVSFTLWRRHGTSLIHGRDAHTRTGAWSGHVEHLRWCRCSSSEPAMQDICNGA